MTPDLKYKTVMRLATRWATEALRLGMQPHDYCAMRFRDYQVFRDKEWSDLTKTILTAFVIREWLTYDKFLNGDKPGWSQ